MPRICVPIGVALSVGQVQARACGYPTACGVSQGISNKARVALRAAGVSPSAIAKINLSDKSAVARAIQKARMSRGQPSNKSSNGGIARAAGESKANSPQSSAARRHSRGTEELGLDEDTQLADAEEAPDSSKQRIIAKQAS